MKKRGKWKIVLYASILSLSFFSIDHEYHPQVKILHANEAFAQYSEGLVYIGSKYYIDHLDNVKSGDVLVYDQRYLSDQNMKILSSYEITNKDSRNEVLEILMAYEQEYPTGWDRTIESMRLEWLLHNFSYCVSNETNRAKDVDLNSKDEEIYHHPIVNKLLKL